MNQLSFNLTYFIYLPIVLLFSDEEKKLCRNIQRLHRVSFSKMRPFGLFYEDMRHTLHVLELLTNYIVVLLQFALL